MKYLLLLFSFLLNLSCIGAQQAYFQQQVDCDIKVTLNDRLHELDGEITIEYLNNSPDTLHEIYLHLWANAFSNRSTAFAQQKLRFSDREFYFSDEKQLGGFSKLDFQTEGQALVWAYWKDQRDIARLVLTEPLLPGQSVMIFSPFGLKIPDSFSRLGHVGESYQLTQWFPKPAVYDAEGWHPMPYLDMGEYYSEFGTIDVQITLPKNYILGATGTLQTPSERAFLLEQAAETRVWMDTLQYPANDYSGGVFPPSATELKTVRYSAERVHDFAWFADKRFRVQHDSVAMPSGRMVETWAMFTEAEQDLWLKGIDYVNRSLQFYSETVGEYPWPQATAVQSALSAGGGMEYPMITVIGLSGTAADLDQVITHEVGHNWFYGILAFNERDHAWLDEGINSYYDHRYMEQYYPEGVPGILPKALLGNEQMDGNEAFYLFQARQHQDQPPATHSDELTYINYWLSAYEKPAAAFKLLEKYLGEARFDAMMQAFYQNWAFKHPQPADVRRFMENHTGQDLAWLFEGLIGSTGHTDYKIRSLTEKNGELRIDLKNKGAITAPLPVASLRGDSILQQKWISGFEKNQLVVLAAEGAEQVSIDPQHHTLEVFRQNNHIRTTGVFRKQEPFRVAFIPQVANDKRTQLYVLPAIAWNNYDKTMLGLGIYNQDLISKPFEYGLFPMYSTEQKTLSGTGHLQYSIFPKGNLFHKIKVELSGRQFHYFTNTTADYSLQYQRWAPALRFDFRTAPASNVSHGLRLRSTVVEAERAVFTTEGNFERTRKQRSEQHQLSYLLDYDHGLRPLAMEASLSYERFPYFNRTENALRFWLDWQQQFYYNAENKVEMRAFVGLFLDKSVDSSLNIFPNSFNAVASGSNDFLFQDYYFGRSEQEGIWTQQISLRDGGLKTPLPAGSRLGRSNSALVALNISADIPGLRLPLRPYADIAWYDRNAEDVVGINLDDPILFNAGLALEVFDRRLGVYIPLLQSANIRDSYSGSFWQRISFVLDLNRLRFSEIRDGLSF